MLNAFYVNTWSALYSLQFQGGAIAHKAPYFCHCINSAINTVSDMYVSCMHIIII